MLECIPQMISDEGLSMCDSRIDTVVSICCSAWLRFHFRASFFLTSAHELSPFPQKSSVWINLQHDSHRIHGAAINGNIDPINNHQYTPFMLAYIPAPWIRHGIVTTSKLSPSRKSSVDTLRLLCPTAQPLSARLCSELLVCIIEFTLEFPHRKSWRQTTYYNSLPSGKLT